MKMKPLLLTTTLVASSMFTVSASASDGTISFNGDIVAATCTINSGSPNLTVMLPTVSTTALATAGSVAGRTAFSIILSNCGTAVSGNVSAYFQTGSTVNTYGRLNNTSGATNVDLELLNDAQDSINLSTQTSTTTAPLVGQAATLNYHVQYYATDAVGAGAVASTVSYSIEYE